MTIEEFVKERDEVLLSLDKDRITAFMKKRGMIIPDDELVFWAMVHKCIFHINAATEEQKQRSKMWLTERGFTTHI